MKIGIITYWDSADNYGQLLQCYALQAFLRSRGHAPFLIRYKEERAVKSGFKLKKIFEYIGNFRSYLNFIKQKRDNATYARQSDNSLRRFDEFRAHHITMSPDLYRRENLMANPPTADAYVCGSDQIWGGSDIYYLSFAPDAIRKIAYAPSFGGINPFLNNAQKISELLRRFDFIGMREASGARLLQEHGFRDATQVCDPTLLLDPTDYDTLLPEAADVKTNDAFVYLLGNQTACETKDIFQFIKSKSWGYTYVASQGRVDEFTKSPLTIPAWIKGVKESKIVITNSFHCVVFALIYHKPFIFIPLGGTFARMNDRLNDILGNSRLTERIFAGSFDAIPDEVDFSAFDNYKAAQKAKAQDIFQKYLS